MNKMRYLSEGGSKLTARISAACGPTFSTFGNCRGPFVFYLRVFHLAIVRFIQKIIQLNHRAAAAAAVKSISSVSVSFRSARAPVNVN